MFQKYTFWSEMVLCVSVHLSELFKKNVNKTQINLHNIFFKDEKQQILTTKLLIEEVLKFNNFLSLLVLYTHTHTHEFC